MYPQQNRLFYSKRKKRRLKVTLALMMDLTLKVVQPLKTIQFQKVKLLKVVFLKVIQPLKIELIKVICSKSNITPGF